jgi:FkbM family methyltransferase
MDAARLLTPVLRAYVRRAPWRLGKRALWEGVAAPLARRPRRFVAQTAYGFRCAGDQRLIMPRCIYWFGTWEPVLSAWIWRTLRPGDVFVDVGANFGYFSLLAARAVGPGGSVVAVEASDATARRLEESLRLNRATNVRIVKAAATALEGSIPFYRAPWNDAESTTVPTEGHELEAEVRAAPLPRLLGGEELARARIIKIDVEGGELGVLAGLAPAAGRLRPDAEIVVEAHADQLAAQGSSAGDLIELLRPAGFRAFELPLDISELAHLAPELPSVGPLRSGEAGLRHLLFSRIRG